MKKIKYRYWLIPILASLIACKPQTPPQADVNQSPVATPVADTSQNQQADFTPPQYPPENLLVLNKDISIVKVWSHVLYDRDGSIATTVLSFQSPPTIKIISFYRYGYKLGKDDVYFSIGNNELPTIYNIHIALPLYDKAERIQIKNKAPLVLEYSKNDNLHYVDIPLNKLPKRRPPKPKYRHDPNLREMMRRIKEDSIKQLQLKNKH